MKFSVPDMSCGHCKMAVEKAVASIDANALVAVDLEARTVDVGGAASEASLLAALKDAGYPASTVPS